MVRYALRSLVLGLMLAGASAGCSIAPKGFFQSRHDPAPIVRARALGMGRDLPGQVVIPTLIEKLNDPDAVVRLTAHEELRKRTGQDFGYAPWAEAPDRAPAVNAWRRWWQTQQSAGGRTNAAVVGRRRGLRR